MLVMIMERKVIEERAHTQPAARQLSAQGNCERLAVRKLDRPLSRFPLRGKAGAGGFPISAKIRIDCTSQTEVSSRHVSPARGLASATRFVSGWLGRIGEKYRGGCTVAGIQLIK